MQSSNWPFSYLSIVIFIAVAGLLLFIVYQIANSKSNHMQTMLGVSNEIVTEDYQTLLVAGGCFWCVEADLEKLPGVISAVSGYAGGTTVDPTYENYAQGGHREVVLVTYDPARVTFREIIIYTIKHLDPTDSEGSFYDRGRSYGPALYFANETEKDIITGVLTTIDANGPYTKPLVVAVEERPTFFAAEDYHQDYYRGALSGLKYQYYRQASGRDAFINEHWGAETAGTLAWESSAQTHDTDPSLYPWLTYQKPSQAELQQQLDPLVFRVTQQDGTERAGSSTLDKENGRGIYVDILSGEPLFSSRDKFDSGTGWPSFTQPIAPGVVTEHKDQTLWMVRTEIRSAIADNHLGHVFPDGPKDRGGLRYCMNGVALRFIPEMDMERLGYVDFITDL